MDDPLAQTVQRFVIVGTFCVLALQSDWLYIATFQQYPIGTVYDRLLVSAVAG